MARRKTTLYDLQSLALEREGKCLSEVFTRIKDKYDWECKYGHHWPATAQNVLGGSWCLGTLEEMQQIAKGRGGECLATEYIDSFTKLPFRCQNGHHFKLKPNRVNRGGWCKHCNVLIGESICRFYLELIFAAPFPKANPSWLHLKRGSYELDGYSEGLGIAFEHHGTYHYKPDRLRSKNELDVKKRQEKDRIKEKLCRDNKVKLIVIPEMFSMTSLVDLGEVVMKQCKVLGIDVPNYQPSAEIDFNSAYVSSYAKGMMERLRLKAAERGGKCVATTWLGAEAKLAFECEKGHTFRSLPFDVLDGHWCLICSGRAPIGLEAVKELANSYGGDCLSEIYVNVSSLLIFVCKNGVIFEDNYAKVKARQVFCRCKKCLADSPLPLGFHSRKALGIEFMHDLALSQRGRVLSATYINGASDLSWKCRNGSIFKATYNQLVARKWFCPCVECKVLKENRIDIK